PGLRTKCCIQTSHFLLMNTDLSRFPHPLGLTKATANTMKQNIAIAVGVVLILLTALLFSNWMNMTIGMLVHELSILVVIFNAMRLMIYRPRGKNANKQNDYGTRRSVRKS